MADDYFSQFQTADNNYFDQFELAPKKSAPKKKVGISAVGEDVISGVKGVLPALGHMAYEAPGQLYDLSGLSDRGEYSTKRAGQVALAGLAKGGRGLMNIPGNAVDYLKGKELIPDWVQAWRPEELNKRNYLQDVGITDQRPGDELIEEGASFIPSLAIGGGLGKLAKTGLGKVASATNTTAPINLAKKLSKLETPASGFAYGVGQNENPVTSALMVPATKGVIKTAKVIASPLKSAKKAVGFKEAEQIRQNAENTSKSLADKIARNDLSAAQKSGSQMYESLISDTQAKGISKAQIPRQLAPDFFKETTRKERAAVRRAFETQDLKDIHDARKDLGKYISKQSKKQLLKPERAALEQAKAIRKNMDKALKDAFSKAGGPEFAERFDSANKHWRENVIPNESSALLSKYREGKITAEDFIKKASKNETFRALFGKKYPEIIEYADALVEADKKLSKAKPSTKAAKELQKDVNRNEMLTQGPKKLGNAATKATGLGGILNWLTK